LYGDAFSFFLFNKDKKQNHCHQHSTKRTRTSTQEEKGKTMGEAIREALSKIDGLPGLQRSREQTDFHEAVIEQWGDPARDPTTNVGSILMEWARGNTILRGRTTAVAMFVAAFMWTQPNADVSLCSLTTRAARALLYKIFLLIRKLANNDDRLAGLVPVDGRFVVSMCQERLVIRPPGGGTASCESLSLQPRPPRPAFQPHEPVATPCGGQC
jgi:hypothetical protein